MTKAEEIATLKAFVTGLPRDSYVRDALEPFLVEFERGVYSDYVPTVIESWRHRREAEEETAKARQQMRDVEAELDRAKRKFRNYCSQIGALERVAKEQRDRLDSAIETLRELGEASVLVTDRHG
jgi:hypothetical protein